MAAIASLCHVAGGAFGGRCRACGLLGGRYFPAWRESLITGTRPACCNGGLMKRFNLTLGLMAAGAMLAAGSGMAQPQPATPAPAAQGRPEERRGGKE